MKLKVKRLNDKAVLPAYGRPGDAGLDLASVDKYLLAHGERRLVSTGLAVEVPEGHVGIIKDRSGIARKHGVAVMAGVIDSGYRGEVRVLLENRSREKKPFFYAVGDRIAQLVILPAPAIEVEEVETLDATERGVRGFGSTGVAEGPASGDDTPTAGVDEVTPTPAYPALEEPDFDIPLIEKTEDNAQDGIAVTGADKTEGKKKPKKRK